MVAKKSKSSASQKKSSQKAASHSSILIIGVGNMGSALAHGLIDFCPEGSLDLTLYDHHENQLENFMGIPDVQVVTTLKKEHIAKADAVIICTKPQDLDSVAQVASGHLKPNAVLISILAAVTIENLASKLKFKGAIVRSMPNIAATVGEAATAMCANRDHTDGQLDLAEEIFATVGTVSWTKESLMDAVTGLSGSGPAYIYMVIEALTDGGVKMGMPRPLALELATQTVLGSAALVQSTGIHPAVLRDQVTTPGGTTITAIHELEERGLRAMLISAVGTATERSKFLRQ
jgi:pyrroline-5-carboxylate reductase